MINDVFFFLEIKQKRFLVHFYGSFLLNDQTFYVCYVFLIQKSHRFSLLDKHKRKSNIFKLLRMLSSVIKQYTLLHKQRWSSTRQNIPFKTFEVTIYATLDTRRKNSCHFSNKNRSLWISHLQKLDMV